MVMLVKNSFAGLIVITIPKPNVGMEMMKMAAAKEFLASKMKMSKIHATMFMTIMENMEIMEAGAKFNFEFCLFFICKR